MIGKQVNLGDICTITSGGTPSRKKSEYYNGSIRWIKTGDLKTKYIQNASEFITELGLKNSSAKLFPSKTVLIALYGATIGACSILDCDAATNQACAALLPSKKVIPEYIYYFMNFNKSDLISRGVGGAQPNISGTILKSYKIPLPSLPIQKKIVQVLDKAQELIDLREKQIQLLDDLVQSVFYDMFGDPGTNTKGWDIGPIRDLAKKTQYGTSKKADEKFGKFPILRMGNITYAGHLNIDNMKFIDLDEFEQKKYLVHKGEVLFNRTNSKELVGKTTLFNLDTPMAFAGYLVKLIPNDRTNGIFISTYMNTKYIKLILLNMAKNIVGMANINAEEFKRIKIYYPPVSLQNMFEEKVKKIKDKKNLMQKSLEEMKNNYNSLMQRAFKGELF